MAVHTAIFALLLICLNVSQFLLLDVKQIKFKKKSLFLLLFLMLSVWLILNYHGQKLYFDEFKKSVGLFLLLGIRFAFYQVGSVSPNNEVKKGEMTWNFFHSIFPAIFVILVSIQQCLSLFVWNR